jgi:hypothetical protein
MTDVDLHIRNCEAISAESRENIATYLLSLLILECHKSKNRKGQLMYRLVVYVKIKNVLCDNCKAWMNLLGPKSKSWHRIVTSLPGGSVLLYYI